MSARLTYLPAGLADMVPGFIALRGDACASSVRVRARHCSTLSMIKALYALRGGPLSFGKFFRRSEIRLKSSFLGYVSICVGYGFIRKYRSGSSSMYAITPKGTAVLDLFVQKSN